MNLFLAIYSKTSISINNLTQIPVVRYNTVNMSVAVATDDGLITPIVTNAERKVCHFEIFFSFIRQKNFCFKMNMSILNTISILTFCIFVQGLATISQDVQDLAQRARDKKLQPHEFQVILLKQKLAKNLLEI